MTDTPQVPPDDSGRPQNLGAILRTSRERKGLELDDVAEVTHVRKEYLKALEEGRYADLPEDVYARNFLRLYAQAVGLESEKLLDMFARERSGGRATRTGAFGDASAGAASSASGRASEQASRPTQPAPRAPAAPERSARSVPSEEPGPQRPAFEGLDGGRGFGFPAIRLGSLLATLLLVAAIVALALWAFNNQLFGARGGDTQPPPVADGGGIPVTPGDGALPSAPEGTPDATEQARDVLVTVESEPAGAEVTVDGFPLPGTTPVRDVPVTARASRLVRVTLDGYEPFESTYDLSFDRTLAVILQPEAPEAPTQAGDPAAAPADGPTPTAGQGEIALNVTEPTWLEVYAGTARGQGTRLVYTTAQPGNNYLFDLPVYVHVGNAAGLHVSVNGQDLGSFGSPGAVMGRAFTP